MTFTSTKQNNRIIVIILLIIGCYTTLSAQTLKVTQSTDHKKVDRNGSDSIATIIIDSHVKGLVVENDMCDEMHELTYRNRTQFSIHVNIKKDRLNQIDNSARSLILNSPKSAEYILETDELFPRQVYYYTVILPDLFPVTLTAEYVYTPTAPYGIRLSYGGRFGGYVSYKWGKYKRTGVNIDEYNQDADVAQAQHIGYIRKGVTAGVRIGLFHKVAPTYIYFGGGYGEYGHQWQNLFQLNNGSTFFYSDYIKGFDGELGVSVNLLKYLQVSTGVEMLFGNGNVSTEFQIGAGVCLNKNLFKRNKR